MSGSPNSFIPWLKSKMALKENLSKTNPSTHYFLSSDPCYLEKRERKSENNEQSDQHSVSTLQTASSSSSEKINMIPPRV